MAKCQVIRMQLRGDAIWFLNSNAGKRILKKLTHAPVCPPICTRRCRISQPRLHQAIIKRAFKWIYMYDVNSSTIFCSSAFMVLLLRLMWRSLMNTKKIVYAQLDSLMMLYCNIGRVPVCYSAVDLYHQ